MPSTSSTTTAMSCWLHTISERMLSASISASSSRRRCHTSTTSQQNFSVSNQSHLLKHQLETNMIIVGPAFPVGHPVTSTRYPTALFTRPTPAFVTNTTQSKTVESALNGASKSEKSTAVQTLYRQAVSDLPAAHKRPKQLKAAFGFFEQSMLFNLGFVLLSTGATIAATVILGKRARAYYSH